MAISISVVGEANMSEFKKAQRELDALRRAAEKSGKAQMSTWDKTSASIKKYDREMTVAGLAVVAGLGLSARAAEEANQANARLEQVFRSMGDASGEGAAQAKAQADELSRLIGVDDEVIKAAQAKLATFRDVSSETARANGIFERATQASADLAATGFGSMESASVMLGKALQDPIKGITAMTRVGVTFTAEEKTKIRVLAESGRMLEAQTLILGAVEKQVGGVAEASATSSAKFGVALGEFQEAVGQQALPAFEGLLSGASTVLDGFGELPDSIQQTTVALTAAGGAALIAAPRIVESTEAISKAMASMRTAATLAQVSMARYTATTALMAAPYAALVATIGAVGFSMATQSKAVKEAREEWEAFEKSVTPDGLQRMREELSAAEANVVDWADSTSFADGVSDQWNRGITALMSVFRNSNTVLEQAQEDTENLAAAQVDLETIYAQVARATGVTTEEARDLASAYGVDLSSGVNTAVAALVEQYDTYGSASAAAVEHKEAVEGVGDAAEFSADAVKEFREELEAASNGYVSTAKATADYEAAIDAAREAVKKNKETVNESRTELDLSTEAGRRNQEQLIGLRDAAFDMSESLKAQNVSQEEVNRNLQEAREEFIRNAEKMGLTRTAAKRLATQVGLIPRKPRIDVQTNLDKAKEDVIAFVAWANTGIPDIVIDPRVRSENAEYGARASSRPSGGGDFGKVPAPLGKGRNAQGGMASGLRVLGEYGPELVQFDQPARVYTAEQTRAVMAGGGAGGLSLTFNIDARGATDPAAVEAAGRRGAEAALELVRQKQLQGVRR